MNGIIGPDGKAPQRQQVNIDIMSQPDIRCEQCNGKFFEPAVMFKKISKILVGSPEDTIAPVQIFLCVQCGAPLDELLPVGLKNQDGKDQGPN